MTGGRLIISAVSLFALYLGEGLVFNEANTSSSRSELLVCSCTSVGRRSRTKTHSMPPTPPESSPPPPLCAYRSGFPSFLCVCVYLCISGQRLHSSRAQKSEQKNPADARAPAESAFDASEGTSG